MTIDKEIIKEFDIKTAKTSTILTANGIIEAPIYQGNFQYESKDVNCSLYLQILVAH